MNKNAKSGIEIERKYIIEMPDIKLLSLQEGYTKSEILQIYLSSEPGETLRIRRRGFIDRVEYTKTSKIRIDNMSSREIEEEISEDDFEALAEQIREGSRPLNKVRHAFSYQGNIIEIDIYPEWRQSAIMETELDSYDKEVSLPSFIVLKKEVTGEKKYSNSAMSSSFPDEIK